jgi:hypothetical protein
VETQSGQMNGCLLVLVVCGALCTDALNETEPVQNS